MTFTDEDLKRLKEYAEHREGMLSTNCIMPANEVKALLARLEAAETALEAIYPCLDSGSQFNYLDILMDSWRKAAGK
jgi:hypothetical protein